MTWELWLRLYLETYCTARGLAAKTIAAYRDTLLRVRFRFGDKEPDKLTAKDILEFVNWLRDEKRNGAAAVNRQVTILRSFFRAIVALGHLEPDDNPMAHFPTMKAAPVKLPTFLSEDEVARLIGNPRTTTVLGLRDRAILALLYGTGIRANEAATMRECDVDLVENTVRVIGKGGHQRAVPLNVVVAQALEQYRTARGKALPSAAFFRSRRGGPTSRFVIYQRVRLHSQKARIDRAVSPHRLRHTFATHLVKRGIQLVTIRDLLGHQSISSTQIYLHTTAEDLREAAKKHPVEQLVARLDLLPNVKLPLQWLPGEKLVRKR